MSLAGTKVRRWSWTELVASEHHGRWIALEEVSYDEFSREPLGGVLVDSDEELSALCSRIQQRDRGACSILFCGESEPASRRYPRRQRSLSAARSAS